MEFIANRILSFVYKKPNRPTNRTSWQTRPCIKFSHLLPVSILPSHTPASSTKHPVPDPSQTELLSILFIRDSSASEAEGTCIVIGLHPPRCRCLFSPLANGRSYTAACGRTNQSISTEEFAIGMQGQGALKFSWAR